MGAKKYGRITYSERFEIEKLLSHHLSYTEVAERLKRNKSSIQREVVKNGGSIKP